MCKCIQRWLLLRSHFVLYPHARIEAKQTNGKPKTAKTHRAPVDCSKCAPVLSRIIVM